MKRHLAIAIAVLVASLASVASAAAWTEYSAKFSQTGAPNCYVHVYDQTYNGGQDEEGYSSVSCESPYTGANKQVGIELEAWNGTGWYNYNNAFLCNPSDCSSFATSNPLSTADIGVQLGGGITFSYLAQGCAEKEGTNYCQDIWSPYFS